MIRLIKRYESRKLYDTEESRYVSLDEIATWVRAGQEVKIVFTESDKEVTCLDTDIILDVAIQNGIELECSCRAGQCGTCKAVLRSGNIVQEVTDGLTNEDAEEGYILTCQAFPKGQVEIEL